MPRLSQLIIRTALIWLAIGYSIAALVLANKGVPFAPWLWTLRSSHIHILLFGWTVQLTFGVAYWIMPRLDKEGSRGNEKLVWISYILLNVGVLAGSSHDPLAALISMNVAWLWIVTAICYIAAVICFALNLFPRILPFLTD